MFAVFCRFIPSLKIEKEYILDYAIICYTFLYETTFQRKTMSLKLMISKETMTMRIMHHMKGQK